MVIVMGNERNKLTSAVITAQSLDETIGCGLHVDEVAAQ